MTYPTTTEAPVDRDKLNDAVRQSLMLSESKAERHAVYPKRPAPLVRAYGVLLAQQAAVSAHRNQQRQEQA